MKKLLFLTLLTSFFSIANAQVNLTNGLLGYYTFSGNANDASSLANNGTVYGPVLTTDRYGNANSAYSFDGINDYISFDPSQLENNEYTFSTWVKPASFAGPGMIVEIGGPAGDQCSYVHNLAGFAGTSYNTTTPTNNVYYNPIPPTNKWYHLIVSRSSTELKLFLNGQLIQTVSVTGLTAKYASSSVGFFGCRYNNAQFFSGTIDDVRIYNRAVNDDEVSALYNYCDGTSRLSYGLVGDYTFTGNADDASPLANHGTVNGPTLTTDRTGTPNSAYLFDGVNDNISFDPTQLKTNEYTYSAWIKPASFGGPGMIVEVGGPAGDQCSYVHSSAGFAGTSYNTTSPTNNVYYYPIPATNQWYHIVVTRSSSELKLYKDNQLIQTVSVAGLTAKYASSSYGFFGQRYNGSEFFSGVIDDVKIYNRALCPEEIDELYNVLSATQKSNTVELQAEVYPNPNSGTFTINSSQKLSNVELSVYNSVGTLVYAKSFSRMNNFEDVNLENFNKGIYVLMIKSDEGAYRKKIIVE